MNSDLSGFAKALEVMARLRAPDGCPWDREQDHQTLKPYIIEEAYEVIEAIDSGSNDDLREELGDLLLQVLFHSQLAQEKGLFNASEVAEKLADKMIDRHPHVFGEDQTDTTNQVLRNWEISKRKVRADRGKNNGAPSILDGVPLGMPALTGRFAAVPRIEGDAVGCAEGEGFDCAFAWGHDFRAPRV